MRGVWLLGRTGMGCRGWGQSLVMSQNAAGVTVSFKRQRESPRLFQDELRDCGPWGDGGEVS